MQSNFTPLLEATDSLAFNIECGNVNVVVFFLALKKALDTVDHDVLLAEPRLYRIQEIAYNCLWFKSYLKAN